MLLNESAQNYLETIYILSQQLPVVRAIDIVTELDYKKSSVSVALKNLREQHYLTVSSAGYITLTETGLDIAKQLYERHVTLTSFLESLGVTASVAAEDACKIEHIISEESFQAIKHHLAQTRSL